MAFPMTTLARQLPGHSNYNGTFCRSMLPLPACNQFEEFSLRGVARDQVHFFKIRFLEISKILVFRDLSLKFLVLDIFL